MPAVADFTVAELSTLLTTTDFNQAAGETILADGWQRPPIDMVIRHGSAVRLYDGNRRIHWLSKNGGDHVKIPVRIHIQNSPVIQTQPIAHESLT